MMVNCFTIILRKNHTEECGDCKCWNLTAQRLYMTFKSIINHAEVDNRNLLKGGSCLSSL